MTTKIPDYSYGNSLFSRTDGIRLIIEYWIADPTQDMFTINSNNPYYNTIDNWDTSLVTDFSSAFYNKTSFNDDISAWDTSNATTFKFMFYDAISFNQDISKKTTAWDTINVTNMQAMFFSGAGSVFNNGESAVIELKFNQTTTTSPINWKLNNNSPVTIISGGSGYSTDLNVEIFAPNRLDKLDNSDIIQATATVTVENGSITYVNITNYGSGYTPSTSKILTITTKPLKWNTSNVTSMTQLFYGCKYFNQDISSWNTSNVKYMQSTFNYAIQFNQDIKTQKIIAADSVTGSSYVAWDVSNVIDFQLTFQGSDFNQDISNWNFGDSGTVTMSMLGMFSYTPFNQDISTKIISDTDIVPEGSSQYIAWNVSNVYNMEYMFESSLFNQDISNWDVSNVTSFKKTFASTAYFNQDISLNLITESNSATGSEYTAWNTINVTSFYEMFDRSKSFNQDISNWDVSKVTTFYKMFNYSIVFKQDLRLWKTNGTGMTSNPTFTNMFANTLSSGVVDTTYYESATPTKDNFDRPLNDANRFFILCFYGFVKIITKDGLKEIKDLKRGELVLTNDGYQPLARLVYSYNHREYKGKQQMVKIPKDFFTKNIPNEDIYTTDTHPLSVKVLSEKEDTDFEYLHLFVKELIGLNNDDKKIKYEYLEEEKYMYNLVFDKHYELNIGGVKFLSHHPNHNNGNLRLSNGNEIDPNNRSKKVYADKKGIYFKRITLKKLLKDKPEQMSDKEYIVSLIQF